MIRGESKRLPTEHPVMLVFEATGRHYGIGRNELLCRSHNGQRHARHMAFFMLHKLVNMSISGMARQLGNNHSSISYGRKKIRKMIEAKELPYSDVIAIGGIYSNLWAQYKKDFK